MKLAKEPKEVDFWIKSKPWSKTDLTDFRKLMREIKPRNKTESNSITKEKIQANETRKAA